jgi:hypothetical protein
MALDQSALLEVLDALKGAARRGRDNAMGTAAHLVEFGRVIWSWESRSCG